MIFDKNKKTEDEFDFIMPMVANKIKGYMARLTVTTGGTVGGKRRESFTITLSDKAQEKYGLKKGDYITFGFSADGSKLAIGKNKNGFMLSQPSGSSSLLVKSTILDGKYPSYIKYGMTPIVINEDRANAEKGMLILTLV